MSRQLIATAFALVFAGSTIAAQAPSEKKSDLSGKWTFTVQSELGSGTPTVTIKQVGDSISGRYSSQLLGERDFTGTFKDGTIAFSFGAEVQGQQFTMSFSGKLDGADTLKGSIDFNGLGTGTFSGKRQP